LYGLLSKKYAGKHQSEFNEVMINIEKNTELARLLDFLYQVSPKSLQIGTSKQELSLAGWTER